MTNSSARRHRHEDRVAALAYDLDRYAAHAPRPSIGVLDQVAAAAHDAYGVLVDFATTMNRIEPGRWGLPPRSFPGQRRSDLVARVLVALDGAAWCPHLHGPSPRPALAALALHRVACGECVDPDATPPASEDDRCDWCGARHVETFTPVGLQVGPLVVVGDACGDCARHLVAAIREGAA